MKKYIINTKTESYFVMSEEIDHQVVDANQNFLHVYYKSKSFFDRVENMMRSNFEIYEEHAHERDEILLQSCLFVVKLDDLYMLIEDDQVVMKTNNLIDIFNYK